MNGNVRFYFTYKSFTYDYILSQARGQPYAYVALPKYVRNKADNIGKTSPNIRTSKQDKARIGHNWWDLL